MIPPRHGFRTFVILWATQSLSVLGSSLSFFAITIWLTQTLYPAPEQKGELALALSALGLSFSVPALIFGPLAGSWVDHHDRKRTMILADLCSGLLSLLMAVMVLANTLQLPSLLVISVGFAFFGAFHGAAFDTSYAVLVPEEQLPRANGMMQSVWSLAGIVAPAIAASIIALPALARQGSLPWSDALAWFRDGAALAMTIDAATFFFAGLVLVFLTVPSPIEKARAAGQSAVAILKADLAIGIRYIGQRPPLLWLLGTFTMVNLLVAVNVLTPLLLKFDLAPDWQARGLSFEAALALLSSVGSVGGVVGGLLVSTWGGLKRRRVYGVLVPVLITALAQIVFGLTTALYVAAIMGFTRAAMQPIMNAHSQSIWQAQTPRELQGRVFAVRRVIAQFTFPLGTALAGWAGGVFDVGAVITWTGVLLALFTIAQFFNPVLLRVDDKAWLDSLAAQREGQQVALRP